MVRFQRLEKLGLKLQKFSLLQRKNVDQGLEIGGIMKKELFCKESLDKTGSK